MPGCVTRSGWNARLDAARRPLGGNRPRFGADRKVARLRRTVGSCEEYPIHRAVHEKRLAPQICRWCRAMGRRARTDRRTGSRRTRGLPGLAAKPLSAGCGQGAGQGVVDYSRRTRASPCGAVPSFVFNTPTSFRFITWASTRIGFMAFSSTGRRQTADRLNGTPWDAPPAAALLRTLALAVAFVHENGFVHRDVKPANVLFKADGTPKLADFGLRGWSTMTAD